MVVILICRALHYADIEDDADIAKALMDGDADLNAETLTVDRLGDCKMTTLSYAAWLNKTRGSEKEPKIDSVHSLNLTKDCVNCQDDSGSTSLMYATQETKVL